MCTDNAGDGRRGLRASVSSRLLDALRDRYDLGTIDNAVDLGGSSNLNLRLDAGRRRYVARVYRPHVRESRLAAIQHVRGELISAGVPCAEPVFTRDAEPWTIIDGRMAEVETFVTNEHAMDSWKLLEIGLPMLGRIHSTLSAIDVAPEVEKPMFTNYVGSTDALDWTRRAAKRVRAWDPSPEEIGLMTAAEDLARRLADAEGEHTSALPRQLAHGDFWDNNVLFNGSRVALVTDFDFMGMRPRIDDLALTLHYANSTFAGDASSTQRIRRLRRLVDAHDSGLDLPLASAERSALPLSIARQPLWWIGKWCALLDDENLARRGLPAMARDVAWAVELVRHVDRWQEEFA